MKYLRSSIQHIGFLSFLNFDVFNGRLRWLCLRIEKLGHSQAGRSSHEGAGDQMLRRDSHPKTWYCWARINTSQYCITQYRRLELSRLWLRIRPSSRCWFPSWKMWEMRGRPRLVLIFLYLVMVGRKGLMSRGASVWPRKMFAAAFIDSAAVVPTEM